MDPTDQQIHDDLSPSPCCCHAEHLSEREVQVLCYVAVGLSNAEAAREMHLSEHTVASHIQSMRVRLAARTRTDLVFRACAVGLIMPAWPPRPTGRRCIDVVQLASRAPTQPDVAAS